jgi:cytochrome c553
MIPRGVVALIALLAPLPAGAADGSQLAASCASCHAAGGTGAAIPSIAGTGAGRIVGLMLGYRSGARQSQIMQIVATALTPGEIVAVAQYLAQQPAGAQP